jgi:hypothetical protein
MREMHINDLVTQQRVFSSAEFVRISHFQMLVILRQGKGLELPQSRRMPDLHGTVYADYGPQPTPGAWYEPWTAPIELAGVVPVRPDYWFMDLE